MGYFFFCMILISMLCINNTNPMKHNPVVVGSLIGFGLLFVLSFDYTSKDEQSNTIYERVTEQFKGDK